MYLTAQRVRSPRGERGINVAHHEHQGLPLTSHVWSLQPAAILERVTQQEPGVTVGATVAIAPGGNAVESFLDVVAPDDTPPRAIEAALEVLRTGLGKTRPEPVRVGNVVAAFAVNLGAVAVAAEFDALASAALALLSSPVRPPWAMGEPLVIEGLREAEAGWSFALSPESAERVRRVGGSPARVSIRDDVASEFRRVHGPLYPHVAEWVTSLSSERLLELGGARFFHQGRFVGEWPKRA